MPQPPKDLTPGAGGVPPIPPVPPHGFLFDVYQHAPLLVVHVNAAGIVLRANAEVTRVTGYSQEELLGRNLWGTFFPGRLFAQIPKFISVNWTEPPAPLRDVALTLRTKEGKERIVAWTRFVHEDQNERSLVLLGQDLTDRLTDADRSAAASTPTMADAAEAGDREAEEANLPFGANVGNAGTVEGEFVTPIAISPPSPINGPGGGAGAGVGHGASTGPSPVQQVYEFLTEMDSRVAALEVACAAGELQSLESIAESLRSGARACGLAGFTEQAEQLQVAAVTGRLNTVTLLVEEIADMCKRRPTPH